MFDYWRERRHIRREYKAFIDKWRRWQKDENGNQVRTLKDNKEFIAEHEKLHKELYSSQSARLKDKASRLGIDLFSQLPKDERDSSGRLTWWYEEEESWGCFQLTDDGMARLRRIIKDRQYELAKKWTDLLAPILSTVISILALLIAVLALYLQTVSDPIIVVPPPH